MSISTGSSELLKEASSGMPALYGKAVMPCKMSPLGSHLPIGKIGKGITLICFPYYHLLKNYFLKWTKKEEKIEDARRRQLTKSFFNWLQAFSIFSSIL